MNTKAHHHSEIITAVGRNFQCEFERQRRGGFLVRCRKFLPLAAYGETVEIARAQAKARIEAWIDEAECRDYR